MRRAAALSLFVAMALCAAARAASAQDDRAVVGEARHRFEAGVALLEGGRYAEAEAELRRSLALRESPVVLYNLALACRGAGAHRRAIVALRRFIELTPSDSLRGDAQTLLRESAAALVHVRLRLAGGATEVSVDDEPLPPGDGPRALELDPGEHRFEARRPGYEPATRREAFAPGSTADVALDASARPRLGTLVVDTGVADATIRVDGRARGEGQVAVPLAPGAHRLEVAAPGRLTVRRAVDVAAGARTSVSVALPRAGASAAPWIGLGVGAAVVAAAVVVLVATAPWDTGPHGTWDTFQAVRVGP